MSEKIALCGRPAADFDTTYRTAMEFLANPYKLWVSDRLTDKRTVLKLAFASPIAYARNEGFRTAEAAIPFRIFNDLERMDSEESEMVPEEHSYRAFKLLVFHTNRQWEITGTINSTITSSGKGWISVDVRSVVPVWRAKGMVINFTKQPAFLEALLKSIDRKVSFA